MIQIRNNEACSYELFHFIAVHRISFHTQIFHKGRFTTIILSREREKLRERERERERGKGRQGEREREGKGDRERERERETEREREKRRHRERERERENIPYEYTKLFFSTGLHSRVEEERISNI